MIPTLFRASYSAATFPAHGVVDLIDCIECFSEQNEDETSEWELAFTYPVDGQGFDELKINAIVVARVNDYSDPQAFRIYSIESTINKTVVVNCQHISYDLINVPVKAFANKTTTINASINQMMANAVYSSSTASERNFDIRADGITETADFKPDTPISMRAMLLDGDSSIKGTFGGDAIYNNYNVRIYATGGADRGVVIDYGVDLVDMTQENSISEMITGILPYYKKSNSDSNYESEPVIYGNICYGPGTYEVQRIEPVDLSEFFPNGVPSVSDLTTQGQKWVRNEKIGYPEISLTISYAKLGQDVRIHDAVRVRFPKMGIDTTAKVVKYKYNVLLERCEEIEVGHAKESSLFNLMDASKLRKGLVPPERIQNESITNNKIAKGGVGKGKIQSEAVGKKEIQRDSIDHELLSKRGSPSGGAVQSDVIENEAVNTQALATGAVTSAILGRSAVIEEKISTAAVAWTKLKEGTGQPATKINSLETEMAYVNRLFAQTATIDSVRAKNIYASDYLYSGGSCGVNSISIGSLSSSVFGTRRPQWTLIDGTYYLTAI